ncbi:MAG: diguanylate cyclase [Sulfurimonas sp. RIFOXYB12_FULL_35_9]|nr:MAG: diguanylate cyclase [Sulfurimonas sp. RIFOXYB12_FULL_35_9]
MDLPSKTKRDTLVLTSIILVLSWGVLYLFLEYQFKNAIQEQFQRISSSTERLFDINLRNSARSLEYVLDHLVAENSLQKAVAEQNYEQIKSVVMHYYSDIKSIQSGVDILTFRSKEGLTLFRAHQMEYFGDYLNKKRTLILDTDKYQRSFSGFEVGNLEMTYRITKPIFYNSVYVGNVELGISPSALLKDLNTVFKTDAGVVIDKSLIDIMLNKNVIPINDNYLLIEDNKNLKKYFSLQEHSSSDSYKVDMNIPLKNHLSETLGYLVVGFDMSLVAKKDTEFMYRLFFIIMAMMSVLGIIHHLGFEKMFKYFSKQVYTDHLTGLLNRHALNDAINSKESRVLILSNIKEFSLINELYGVDVGNEILIQVADAFSDFAQKNALDTYRISSDEYVLLKREDIFDEERYFVLIEELHKTINSLKIFVHGIDENIGIEIYSGIAFDHSHSLEDAQMAIKKAKKQSLTYVMYSQNVDTKEQSQIVMKVKRTIRHALEHKNVVPFFQSISDRDGKILKYEALVRIIEFDEGEKRVLYPSEFLDISINSGLYIKIAQEMLEKSLAFFINRDEKISLNFLPNDFFNPSIMNALMGAIEKFDSPQKIVVEITEQEGIENFDRLAKVVKKLRAMGVLIAIDDFGSGYANYAHILELKPDYIKIDGSLIQNILSDNDSKILVQSIVRFAHELNITTVAEYVENEEIFELLKEYGVDEFQGYYFGRPTDLINS